MIRCWIKKHADNYEDADDFYAEIINDLYYYIDSFQPGKEVVPWLVVMMRRKIAYLNKREKKKREQRTTANEHYVSSHMDFAVRPDEMLDVQVEHVASDIGDPVLDALNELDPKDRQMLILRSKGYLPKEIAAIECDSPNPSSLYVEQVRARLRAVQVFLQSRITRDGEKRQYTETRDQGEAHPDIEGCASGDDEERPDPFPRYRKTEEHCGDGEIIDKLDGYVRGHKW